MIFSVVQPGEPPVIAESPCAVLVADNWDDWFEFSTMYQLIVYPGDGRGLKVGDVKIGQFGMVKDQRRPNIGVSFTALSDSFFSLGQDDSYYEQLNEFGTQLKYEILQGLNDIALDPDLFERASSEWVTRQSLMRSVSESTVRQQFRRIIRGGARLSPYHFSYRLAASFSTSDAGLLDFRVIPESEPPSNVHVVIGSNGVGKTLLLNNMARAITSGDSNYGNFEFHVEDWASASDNMSFAGVVSVSFSAFDQFALPHPPETFSPSIRYEYVGLRVAEGTPTGIAYRPKSPQELAADFATSSGTCRIGTKVERWERALDALESDLIFREKSISNIAFQHWDDDPERRKAMIALFDELSSGHKLVLLTITRLVEVVEEGTLVLLDEPEAHLHPPLLGTFVRALSELLMNRNGVAIIATHSPVVLQEVPARCVWKLYRLGDQTEALRPEVETFGENVGVLTREVFGLEVTESGFHRMIANRAAHSRSYEEAVRAFEGELGGEARALLRALMIEKEDRDEL